MTRHVWAILAAAVLCGPGAATGQEPAEPGSRPASGPTVLSLVEQDLVNRIRDLERTGGPKEVLAMTTTLSLEDRRYPLCREVLLAQSEAYRRTGQYPQASATIGRLIALAQKEPSHSRGDALAELMMLPKAYSCLRGKGHYQSPRIHGAASTGSAPSDKPVSDDEAWGAAKRDYAQHFLGAVDASVARLGEKRTTSRLLEEYRTVLDVLDAVFPHCPDIAAQKTVAGTTEFLKRYDQLMDAACQSGLGRAAAMREGTLFKGKVVTVNQKRDIAFGVHAGVRDLYVSHYVWGRTVTRYLRKRGLLSEMQGDLQAMAERAKTLQDAWVEVDNYMYNAYQTHRMGEANDPLKKIPTDPW